MVMTLQRLNKKYWPLQLSIYEDVDEIEDWCLKHLEYDEWKIVACQPTNYWISNLKPLALIVCKDVRIESVLRLKFDTNFKKPISKEPWFY